MIFPLLLFWIFPICSVQLPPLESKQLYALFDPKVLDSSRPPILSLHPTAYFFSPLFLRSKRRLSSAASSVWCVFRRRRFPVSVSKASKNSRLQPPHSSSLWSAGLSWGLDSSSPGASSRRDSPLRCSSCEGEGGPVKHTQSPSSPICYSTTTQGSISLAAAFSFFFLFSSLYLFPFLYFSVSGLTVFTSPIHHLSLPPSVCLFGVLSNDVLAKVVMHVVTPQLQSESCGML